MKKYRLVLYNGDVKEYTNKNISIADYARECNSHIGDNKSIHLHCVAVREGKEDKILWTL